MRRGAMIGVALSAATLVSARASAPDPEAGIKMHQALRAFDQCTDRAIYRGEDYAYGLCAHSVYEARAISDAAGLGYKPTAQDIRAVIRRKIAEVMRNMPTRPAPRPAYNY